MKKVLVLIAAVFCSLSAVYAQGYIFVNSETIFKSQASYNTAIKDLETLAQTYQKNIDEAYAELDKTFNNYQAQKSYLSESARQIREEDIIKREKEIEKYQEDVLGQDGDLMKKRVEKIKPIQDKVFGAINSYAEKNGNSMVIDIVNNATLLYYSKSLDKTQEVINLLNTMP